MWSAVAKRVGRAATPLWLGAERPLVAVSQHWAARTAPPEAKAPSPLRSAGALHKAACSGPRLGAWFLHTDV